MTRKKSKSVLSIKFIGKIIIPAILLAGLFAGTMFKFFIPAFEASVINKKREMIKELTNAVVSSIDFYYRNYEQDTALSKAKKHVRAIRYGKENKDYFWIIDQEPTMLMHPYKPELEGESMADFKDEDEKKMFVEMLAATKTTGEGFVDYRWQWKNDSTKIVPKLSYVKAYKPGKIIVGTGIYIEDVKAEIVQMERKIIIASIVILILIIAGLTFIAVQGYIIERKRLIATDKLKESENKYKTLVEAATEGIILVVDQRIVYSNSVFNYATGILPQNKAFNEILSQNNSAFNAEKWEDIFNNKVQFPVNGIVNIQAKAENISFDFSVAPIDYNQKQGFIISFRDAASKLKIEEELSKAKMKFKVLANHVNLGVFRLNKDYRIFEFNKYLQSLFDIEEKEMLFNLDLNDYFSRKNDFEEIVQTLGKGVSVEKKTCEMFSKTGRKFVASISMISVTDPNNNNAFYDGIIEDITEETQLLHENTQFIKQLQQNLSYLNRSLPEVSSVLPKISYNTSCKEASLIMQNNNTDFVLVITDKNESIGIVDSALLREKIFMEAISKDTSVHEVMQSPINYIDENKNVQDASLLMEELKADYLVVRNVNKDIQGIVTYKNLLLNQNTNQSIYLNSIDNALYPHQLQSVYKSLPQVIKTMLTGGIPIKEITAFSSRVSDKIVHKLIEYAISKIGKPPVEFSFICFGSEGRAEQTLYTDQDNAIIFENTGDIASNKEYFLKLGTEVCDRLNDIGYAFCKGGNMAKNPDYVMSLDEWKLFFDNKISNSQPKDVLAFGIFFDMKATYGKESLMQELKDFIFSSINTSSVFLYHLAATAASYKIPLNLFGNITDKEIDLKKLMLPVVMGARLYALKEKTSKTNTVERLSMLKSGFAKKDLDELIYFYEYLMKLRFRTQISEFAEQEVLSNTITIKNLNTFEEVVIKKGINIISQFQSKISGEFNQ